MGLTTFPYLPTSQRSRNVYLFRVCLFRDRLLWRRIPTINGNNRRCAFWHGLTAVWPSNGHPDSDGNSVNLPMQNKPCPSTAFSWQYLVLPLTRSDHHLRGVTLSVGLHTTPLPESHANLGYC